MARTPLDIGAFWLVPNHTVYWRVPNFTTQVGSPNEPFLPHCSHRWGGNSRTSLPNTRPSPCTPCLSLCFSRTCTPGTRGAPKCREKYEACAGGITAGEPPYRSNSVGKYSIFYCGLLILRERSGGKKHFVFAYPRRGRYPYALRFKLIEWKMALSTIFRAGDRHTAR